MVAPVFLVYPTGLSVVPTTYHQPNPKLRLSHEAGGRVLHDLHVAFHLKQPQESEVSSMC